MAFSGRLFGQALLHLARKRVDLLSDDIRLTLHTSTFAPNVDVMDYVDDLTNELPAAGGYTVGGVALANKTVTYDVATDTTVFDADDVSIPTSTLTWRTGVTSDRTPATAATQPLLSYQTSDADIVSTGGTTTVQFSASGIIRLTAS